MKAKLIVLVIVCVLSTFQISKAQDALAKIKTIVVIYAENRSFDHLYGFFPGANGIANATTEQKTQLDHDGEPLPYLTIFGPDGKPHVRRYVHRRRLGHGLFRWQPTAHVAMGKRIHASRQFLYGSLRRLAPQPSMVDLRLRAAPRKRAG